MKIEVTYKIDENKEFKAWYVGSGNYLVKFGPYPNKKEMINGIKEYMIAIKSSYKTKRE